jgi:Arc/MetJ family transcription regulator
MDHMIEIDERQNGIEATCEAVKQIALDTKKEIFELMAKEKVAQLDDKEELRKYE